MPTLDAVWMQTLFFSTDKTFKLLMHVLKLLNHAFRILFLNVSIWLFLQAAGSIYQYQSNKKERLDHYFTCSDNEDQKVFTHLIREFPSQAQFSTRLKRCGRNKTPKFRLSIWLNKAYSHFILGKCRLLFSVSSPGMRGILTISKTT